MSNEDLNVCLTCFYTSARKKDDSYCKSSSFKSPLIVFFARRRITNKWIKKASSGVENLMQQLFHAPLLVTYLPSCIRPTRARRITVNYYHFVGHYGTFYGLKWRIWRAKIRFSPLN